jgi:hypothetical protein
MVHFKYADEDAPLMDSIGVAFTTEAPDDAAQRSSVAQPKAANPGFCKFTEPPFVPTYA